MKTYSRFRLILLLSLLFILCFSVPLTFALDTTDWDRVLSSTPSQNVAIDVLEDALAATGKKKPAFVLGDQARSEFWGFYVDSRLNSLRVAQADPRLQIHHEGRYQMERIITGTPTIQGERFRFYRIELTKGSALVPQWVLLVFNTRRELVHGEASNGLGGYVADFQDLERYMVLRGGDGASPWSVLSLKVRLNLDRSFYSGVEVVADAEAADVLVLVNKYYRFDQAYKPEGLVAVDKRFARKGWQYWLREDAYQAFLQMREAAAAKGLNLIVVSAYRSYDTQTNLYANYVARDGKAMADAYSARAGHSEHQSGLAIDINSTSGNFGGSAEFKWLKANAHRYGFILRYPDKKTAITGFKYEPWHWRFIGVEDAKRLHEMQEELGRPLTFEEYLDLTHF